MTLREELAAAGAELTAPDGIGELVTYWHTGGLYPRVVQAIVKRFEFEPDGEGLTVLRSAEVRIQNHATRGTDTYDAQDEITLPMQIGKTAARYRIDALLVHNELFRVFRVIE